MEQDLTTRLAQLSARPTNLFNGDFLRTWDHSPDQLRTLLNLVDILEQLYRDNHSARVFDGGLALSIFRDQSTRTRFSFASAASLLGLNLVDLDETKTQIAHGETVRETANMISFLTEVIGIRDDMFVGAGHTYMREVAAALEGGYRDGVLPQRPAVINLQCDQDHPTQSLADLAHLKALYGSLEALQGKKLAMTWAYSPSYGKPLSVPQGIIALMTRFGMQVSLAYPEGYDLLPEIVAQAGAFATASGGSFTVGHEMDAAFEQADIVYPKSWAPLAVMEKRTTLLRAGETAALKDLEREGLAQNARHQDWTCDEARMARTRGGRAHYLHCLPADITGVSCPAGEVAASVFDRYRSDTYREAGHKPYVMAAMILLTRFPDPGARLREVLAAGRRRR